jgi:acyl-CoA reductase-like NAD-dependent aldehyde dehydrogenase
MTLRENGSSSVSGWRSVGALVCARLRQEAERLSQAACMELGLPISFVHEQLTYAAQCLADLTTKDIDSEGRPEAAFLFPSNTEGAMPIYILALASSMGISAHARLSQRCTGIQASLERVFSGIEQVRFHTGSGRDFLHDMLNNPRVRFVQVFGDDAWVSTYEERVRATGKILAFDGPGKDPFIVLESADLEAAVQGAIASGLFAGGAACMSAERFLVHESLVEAFTEALVRELSELSPSQPDSHDTVLGYMYSAKAVARMQEQITEALRNGARLLLQGRVQPVSFRGRSFHACSPWVLGDVRHGWRILTEETFGPVFPIQTFDMADRAVELAEDCPYGLTATVFGSGQSADHVAHRLRSSHAIVYVNETMLEAFRPEYWGSGGFKRSGWIWHTDPTGRFQMREGYRPLVAELNRLTQQ